MHSCILAVVATQGHYVRSLEKEASSWKVWEVAACLWGARKSSAWVGWIGRRLARRFQQLILSDRFPLPHHPANIPIDPYSMLCQTNHTRPFGWKAKRIYWYRCQSWTCQAYWIWRNSHGKIESQLICRCPPNSLVIAKSSPHTMSRRLSHAGTTSSNSNYLFFINP